MTAYTTVTEIPGQGATEEQLAMLRTRYGIAGELVRNHDVLEVACGSGFGLKYLASRAKRVVGGDFDARMVTLAARHRSEWIDVVRMDAHQLPFGTGRFDVVLLLEALYYLSDTACFLSEARRVLRRDGVLFVCFPNRDWKGFNPSPFSRRYYSLEELEPLLTEAGFAMEAHTGFSAHDSGSHPRFLRRLRRIAVALRLIPRTMRGKAVLKRLLFGRLHPIPETLPNSWTASLSDLLPATAGVTPRDHKVLYVIARPASPESSGPC